MASLKSSQNGSPAEWDGEGNREWELPGEFLEGRRRGERTGDQPFFFSDHEIGTVIAAVRGKTKQIPVRSPEDEE